MKQILIALICAPSMLAAKAASPMAMSAPIEMATFRLDEEPTVALPQPTEADLKAQMNPCVDNFIHLLLNATQAYKSANIDAATKLKAEIKEASITAQTFWEAGWRPEAAQVAALSKAITNFNAAQNAEVGRRKSLVAAQQSPKNHSTK